MVSTIFLCITLALMAALIVFASNIYEDRAKLRVEVQRLNEILRERLHEHDNMSDLIFMNQNEIRRQNQIIHGITEAHKRDATEFNITIRIYKERIEELEKRLYTDI